MDSGGHGSTCHSHHTLFEINKVRLRDGRRPLKLSIAIQEVRSKLFLNVGLLIVNSILLATLLYAVVGGPSAHHFTH